MKRSPAPLICAVLICAVFAVVMFTVIPESAEAQSAQTVHPDAVAQESAAADYCVKKGGVIEVRVPYFNTNDNEQNWLRLSGSRSFCKFTSKKDGSRIHILLATLYTEKPSLAALAYYAEVPYSGTCNGNPASCYCTQIGGTDLFGGINFNGGGWVLKTDPIDTVLEACIMPDMSTIDSWGLTYHQAGIIRGKDLEKVLKFPNPYNSNKSTGGAAKP